MKVIGDDDAGAKEDIIFNKSELSDVDMVVNFHIVPDDAAVVDDRVTPDTEIVPDDVFLSNNHIVTGLQTAANAATAIDNGPATNAGSGANNQKVVITPGRWVAKDYTIINNGLISQLHHLVNILRSVIRLHLISPSPILASCPGLGRNRVYFFSLPSVRKGPIGRFQNVEYFESSPAIASRPLAFGNTFDEMGALQLQRLGI